MAEEIKKDVQTTEQTKDIDKEANRLQQELEVALAEKKKLKEAFDKTSSEAAELKRKEKERMSEEDKERARIEELENNHKAVILELNKTKAESVFAKKGWEETEYKSVIEALSANVAPDKMVDVATEITKLVSARESKTSELTKNSLTKDTETEIKQKTSDSVSDFKNYQEQKKPSFEKKLKFD